MLAVSGLSVDQLIDFTMVELLFLSLNIEALHQYVLVVKLDLIKLVFIDVLWLLI